MDLKKRYIDYEVKRARTALERDLLAIKRDAEAALQCLARGDWHCHISGLSNALSDAHRRLGQLEILYDFEKMDEDVTASSPAPTQTLSFDQEKKR